MKKVPESVKARFRERFAADSLSFLGGGQDWSDGILFTYESGVTAGRPVTMVLKILEFRRTDKEALVRAQEKLELFRFFGEQGARIVRPCPSRLGSVFETADEGDAVYMAYTYPKAPGRPVESGDRCVRTGTFYKAMGEVLGRLHAISRARPETITAEGCSDSAPALKGWRDEWAFFRSWCKDDEVGGAWERVRDALALLPIDKDGYGFVHNDAHAWNMIFDPEAEPARNGGEPKLTVIDFDCANYHWFANDSAVALYSILILVSGGIETPSGPPEGFRDWAFQAFWDGYRRHREPGEEWLLRLDLFLQYRRCLIFMPFQEATAKNPAWRKRWKARILSEDARLLR